MRFNNAVDSMTNVERGYVEAIACCLVREYLSRKAQEIEKLGDVLVAMEKVFPRGNLCFQQRDQLIRAVCIEKASKDNKASATPYRSLLEILIADRLEKRRLKLATRDAPIEKPPSNGAQLQQSATSSENQSNEGRSSLPANNDSPAELTTRATISILAPRPRNSPEAVRPVLRRGRTEFFTREQTDIYSTSDEEQEPVKVVPRERDKVRPQSARFRPSDQIRMSSNKNGDIDSSRRKFAWNNLTNGSIAPPNISATMNAVQPVVQTNGQRSQTTALLERTDSILRKKSAQRVMPQQQQPDDVSLEDLTLQHDDHGNLTPGEKRTFAHRKITVSENEQLQKLLFGDSTRCFGDEWLRQGLLFTRENSAVPYGLKQSRGGPCGVLAVTQAYLIKQLLWPQGRADGDFSSRLQATESERRSALLRGIHEMILQTNPVGPYKYVLGKVTPSQRTAFTSLTIYNLPSGAQLLEFLMAQQEDVMRDGVVQLLISVILSKGVDAVRKDYSDQADNVLISKHNHTSQEIVNLMLVGSAVSNLFDGEMAMTPSLILRGVTTRASCGFLSLMETSGNIAVGSNLKTPNFPVWVVLSENHYFVTFGTSLDVLSTKSKFKLYAYDGLANVDGHTIIDVDPSLTREDSEDELSRNPIELCVRTRWKNATVDVPE